MAGKVDAKDDFYGEFRRHSTEFQIGPGRGDRKKTDLTTTLCARFKISLAAR